MISDIYCGRCGSFDMVLKEYEDGTYLICHECGQKKEKIKSNARYIEILNQLKKDGADEVAYKKLRFAKIGTICRCSNCNALIYKSWLPRPEGQYDMTQAKYCPQCGSKFLGVE